MCDVVRTVRIRRLWPGRGSPCRRAPNAYLAARAGEGVGLTVRGVAPASGSFDLARFQMPRCRPKIIAPDPAAVPCFTNRYVGDNDVPVVPPTPWAKDGARPDDATTPGITGCSLRVSAVRKNWSPNRLMVPVQEEQGLGHGSDPGRPGGLARPACCIGSRRSATFNRPQPLPGEFTGKR